MYRDVKPAKRFRQKAISSPIVVDSDSDEMDCKTTMKRFKANNREKKEKIVITSSDEQ